MTIQSVLQFTNSLKCRKETFDILELSRADMKAIRSTTLCFNLTPRASKHICSYEVTPFKASIIDKLKSGNVKTWAGLALTVGSLALTLFGIYASHTHGIFQGSLWKDIACVSFMGAVPITYSYGMLEKSLSAYRVVMEMKELITREIPKVLANAVDSDNNLMDPITFESIPREMMVSPAYIYLNNYVVGSVNFLFTLLAKPSKTDQYGVIRLDHSLDGHTLCLDDSFDLEERIIEIYGYDVHRIAVGSWRGDLIQSGEEKKRRLLQLFDDSVHPLFEGYIN